MAMADEATRKMAAIAAVLSLLESTDVLRIGGGNAARHGHKIIGG